MLLSLVEIPNVVFSVSFDVATIAMHLVFWNLSFVNCSIVHDMAADTFNVIVVVKLAKEIREFFTLSKLFVKTDFWESTQGLDSSKI